MKIRYFVPVLLLAACASNPAPAPAPAPAKLGVTIVAPAAPAVATATASAPVVSVADTPAPSPTSAEQPAPAAETATPEAVASVATDTQGAIAGGFNPYTGLPISADAAVRKALLVKIANTVEVRPQSGLNSADVVVEHLSEGSITRFTALFLTNDVKKIGSVRSCRLIDLELPVMFDAALVCSGTSPGVKQLMRKSYAFTNNLTMISDFGPFECARCPMYRTSGAAPHNLFANTANAWTELTKRGVNIGSRFASWVFNSQPGAEGRATQQVDIGYKSGVVGWRYEGGKWVRSLSGRTQNDANTGKPLAFDNVVVVLANHVTTLIQEDVTGARSIEIQVWGEGPVRIFRDGREYGGTWKRNANLGNFEFFDPSGKPIPLKPGNTWIQMVPLTGPDSGVATR
jgi:hypothetical protein